MTPCQFARLLKLKYRVVRVWYEHEDSVIVRTNRDVLITCGLTGKTLLVEKWGEAGRNMPFTRTYFWAMFCDFYGDGYEFWISNFQSLLTDDYDKRRWQRGQELHDLLGKNLELTEQITWVDTSGE